MVVGDVQGADFTGGGLEVVEGDRGVACSAGDEQDAARAGGVPGGAVDLVQAGALAARRVGGGLALVVQLHDLHAVANGAHTGVVEGDREAVVDHRADRVLEAVDHDGVGLVGGGEVGEEVGLLVEGGGQRTFPDHEPFAQDLLVGGEDAARHGLGDLLGAVHRQVEHAPAGGDGHLQDGLLQADASEDHLMGQGGLADAWSSDDHQALAGCPDGLLSGAPQGLGVRAALLDERPPVGDEPRESSLPRGQGALALGPDLGLDLAADDVGVRSGLHGPLHRAQARGAQAPQVGHPAHDPRIVGGAADRGGGGSEPVHVCGAADTLQLVLLAQPVAEHDRVSGLVLAAQGEDRPPDRLVRRPVEVRPVEQVPYGVDHCGVVHARAQHGGFGVRVVRWHGGEVVEGAGGPVGVVVWRGRTRFVHTGH